MFSISKRAGRIGTSINVRTQFSGEDDKDGALDIPISGVVITAEELNALLQEPHAYNMLYSVREGGKFIEPLFGSKIKPLELSEKIEEGNVEIFLAGKNVLKLAHVKLKGVTLELKVGGNTELSFKIQCVPKLDSNIARLIEKLDCEVEITVRVDGYGEQQDAFKGKGANGTDAVKVDGKHAGEEARAVKAAKGGGKRSHKKKPPASTGVDTPPASEATH